MPEYCEAWPGNTNATLPIVNSSPEPSRVNARGRELLFDFFIDARAGETRCNPDGVFHSLGVGAPVADHAYSPNTQERRSSILRVINRLSQTLQRSPRKQKADLRSQRTLDRLLEQPKDLHG